jgi:hypothetical protein
MAQLYADENFPLPIVEELRRLGHDVLTIFEDGKANQQYPDASVLRDATAGERVVLTLNRRHFRRLHETATGHAGMILCTYDPDFVALARRIHEALATLETLRGQLVRVNRPSGSADSP